MSDGTTTWNYTYDANGMRTQRSNGTTTYNYVYNGSQLIQMTVGNDTLYFTYGAIGPTTVTWNGTTYYYAVNGQGDVIGIFDGSGNCVVNYNWDNAWGYNPEPEGSMAATLGTLNPLRYRSYVYDEETELYYLQSRYYDPEISRFINADALVATGQGLLGNNMFAYCNNNTVNYADPSGMCPHDGKFYTSGPFVGAFQYNPDCFYCAAHGEFWIRDIYGNSYDMTQYEQHEFTQMAICTDGAENAYNSQSHQNQTAYSINGEYMDPSKIHYVVAPVGYKGVNDGDLALVIDYKTGKSVFAIVGDRGPKGKHNEVSLSVAWDLCYTWADGSKGPKGEFIILYYPGTKNKWASVGELADYLN